MPRWPRRWTTCSGAGSCSPASSTTAGICLTNNAAERALRGIALGRKSWLFAGSDRGGRARGGDIHPDRHRQAQRRRSAGLARRCPRPHRGHAADPAPRTPPLEPGPRAEARSRRIEPAPRRRAPDRAWHFIDCITALPNSARNTPRSSADAYRAAAMYTLIGTAKLNDVDPQAWLTDALGRIAGTPQSRLDELLPWNWTPRAATPSGRIGRKVRLAP